MGRSMTWTAEADAKLFLFVLSQNNVKIDYEAAAEYLSNGEVTVTPSAVAKHISVLRVNMKQSESSAQKTPTGTPTKSKSTPKKDTSAKKTTSPKKKRSEDELVEDDDDAADNHSRAPTVKVPSSPTPTPAAKRQRVTQDSAPRGREEPVVVINKSPTPKNVPMLDAKPPETKTGDGQEENKGKASDLV